eukprot:scaffold3854_cov120-Skeletonema_marinoi.AAC.2
MALSTAAGSLTALFRNGDEGASPSLLLFKFSTADVVATRSPSFTPPWLCLLDSVFPTTIIAAVVIVIFTCIDHLDTIFYCASFSCVMNSKNRLKEEGTCQPDRSIVAIVFTPMFMVVWMEPLVLTLQIGEDTFPGQI